MSSPDLPFPTSAPEPAPAPASASAPAPATAPAKPWSLAQRIGFRFAFVYFVLHIFPFPLGPIPGTGWIGDLYGSFWDAIVPWVGEHMLHLGPSNRIEITGSGDTPFDWAQYVCILVIAAVATLVWSIVDRRRTEYTTLLAGLRIYIRYSLAATMVGYGLGKFTQFPPPQPERLVQPYGESSPMGLLWTFMGFSAVYSLFTGFAETLGGILVLFRRTTTLGALVVVGVMSNVVLLNFCFDVPVKLFSSRLLLMAIFLLLPDLQRLANFFLLDRPTAPRPPRLPFKVKWQERAWIAVKVAMLGLILILQGYQEYETYQMVRSAPKHPFTGIYEVESFTRDGQEVLPLLTEITRWRLVTVNRYGTLVVRRMDDAQRYRAEDDPEKKTLSLLSGRDPNAPKPLLNYSRPDPEHVVLEGTYENAALNVRLRKVDEGKYLLVNRGFHWINEQAFNR